MQIQLQFIIILGFNAPRNCPFLGYLPNASTFPQYQPYAGGRKSGQGRVGSGLCQGSAGDLERLLQGGEGKAQNRSGWWGRWHLYGGMGLEQLPVSVCWARPTPVPTLHSPASRHPPLPQKPFCTDHTQTGTLQNDITQFHNIHG